MLSTNARGQRSRFAMADRVKDTQVSVQTQALFKKLFCAKWIGAEKQQPGQLTPSGLLPQYNMRSRTCAAGVVKF
jgi:hypothetical protein